MINYRFSKKLNLLGIDESNHLIIILTILSCESLFKSGFHIELAEAVQ